MLAWNEAARQNFLQMQYAARQKYYQAHFPRASQDIIWEGSAPLGQLYVDRRETEIRILDIALLPQVRGCGIGTRFLYDLMEEAQSNQKKISIYVDTSSPFLAWFQHLGFISAEENGISCLLEWHPAAP